MRLKPQTYIDSLTARGEIALTATQFRQALGLSYSAALNALSRLCKKKEIVSPSKGYYLILTPEFREQGCLPADYFIDSLMHHWQQPYYVCLLSAALYHGAAHQQPQRFQVMTLNKKTRLSCGHISIEFIQNSQCAKVPTQSIKTRTGYMKISTPETTAMDMLKYIRQSGGISRITTVLEELAETISPKVLADLAIQSEEQTWIHRLGFLFDQLNYPILANVLYDKIEKGKQPVDIIPLVPYTPITGAPRNKKWHIAINATVESDLHDTD